jgi:hypothetical protein
MSLVVLFAVVQALPFMAQPAHRVDYGKPFELADAKSVYVWTEKNEELRAEVLRQLAEHLPMLVIAENEADGDVSLMVTRATAPAIEGSKEKVITSSRAARAVGTVVRVYVDGSSEAEDLVVAVDEVVTPFVSFLQRANPRRFGKPPEVKREMGKPRKATVHTTAGLKPGMSKRDVLAAIGGPTKMDRGHGFTESWVYVTTDGEMRLVFGGDRLRTVVFPKKK